MSAILKHALCCVCEQHFNVRDWKNVHGQRIPLILNCGHAACEQCIQQKRAKGIVCGTCQTVSTYSGNPKDIRSAFPPHLYLIGRFLSRKTSAPELCFQPVKAQQEKAPKKIILCTECETSKATCHCVQCAAPFCNSCFSQVHKTGKALKSHVKEDLSSAECRTPLMCPKHPKNELDMHCENCNESVCLKCSVLSHGGHDIVSTCELNDKLLPDLKKSLDRASQQYLRLKQTMKEVSVELEGESDVKEKDALRVAEQQLATRMIFLFGRLQLHENRLLTQIEDKLSEGESCLQTIRSSLSDYLTDLEGAMKVARLASLPENCNYSNIYSVRMQLDKAASVPSHLARPEFAVKVTTSDDLLNQLEEFIKLDISGTKKYSLLSEDQLPPSLIVAPLCENLIDIEPDLSSSSLSDFAEEVSSSSKTSTSSMCKATRKGFETKSIMPPSFVPAGMSFKDRNNVPLSKQMKDPREEFSIGSSSTVQVSHIKTNDLHFYVQPLSSVELLNKLTNKFFKMAQSSGTVKKIQINKVYLVKYPEDNMWYRGSVTEEIVSSVPEKKVLYNVFYIDYGNHSEVDPSMIKELPREYANAPSQAVLCSLYGLKPVSGEWDRSAAATFTLLLDESQIQTMHVIGSSGDILLVDLSHTSSKTDSQTVSSVRDSMIYLEKGSFVDGGIPTWMSHSSVHNCKYVKDSKVSVGSSLDVGITYIESPHNFYVAEYCNESVLKVLKEMNLHYSKMKDDKNSIRDPYIGMPCVTQFSFDDVWYRAVILEILPPQKVLVQYVDYGNKEEVLWTKVKFILEKFLKPPVQAIQCSLDNIAPVGETWTQEAKEVLEKLTDSEMMKIRIIRQECDLFHVELLQKSEQNVLCINTLLVDRGFAKYINERSKNSFKLLKRASQEKKRIPSMNERKFLKLPDNLVGYFEGEKSSSDEEGKTTSSEPFVCEGSVSDFDASIVGSMKTENSVLENVLVNNEPQCQKGDNEKQSLKENDVQMFERVSLSSIVDRSVAPPTECEQSMVAGTNFDKQNNNENSVQSRSNNRGGRRSVQGRLKQAQKDFTISNTEFPGKIPVEVLNPESPSCIYVRLKNLKGIIDRLFNCMTLFYNGGGLLEESSEWTPSVGERCAVKSNDEYQLWYRALILEVMPDSQFKVELKDLGRTEVVKKQSLRKLSPQFLSVKDGAFKCHLADVKVAGACRPGEKSEWSTLACTALKDIVQENQSNLFISKKGQINLQERSMPVELWVSHIVSNALEPNKMEWFTINKLLIEKGAALPERRTQVTDEDILLTSDDFNILNVCTNSDSMLYESSTQDSSSSDFCCSEDNDAGNSDIQDWSPAQPLPEGVFKAMPTYVDYDCHVYLHDVAKSAQTLRKINKCLYKKFKDTKPQIEDNFWFENQICVVQYHLDNKWYRGKVVKIAADNSMAVQFVDYGNVEDKCRSNVLRKNVSLKATPIIGRRCRIEGLQPISPDGKWTRHTLDFIHHCLVDVECKVRVVRKPQPNENVYLVDLYLPNGENIKKFLAENGFAAIQLDSSRSGLPPPEDFSNDEEEDPDVIVLEERDDFGLVNHDSSGSERKCDAQLESLDNVLLNNQSSTAPFNELVLNLPNSSDLKLEPNPADLHFTDIINQRMKGLRQNLLNESIFQQAIIPKEDRWQVTVPTVLSATQLVIHVLDVPDDSKFNLDSFKEFFDIMQQQAPHQPPVFPIYQGKACCVLQEEVWLRGLVKVVNGDTVCVELVDGGNEETFTVNDLRRIRVEWLSVPLLSIICNLSEVAISPNHSVTEVRKALLHCVSHQPLEAQVVKRDPLEIELYLWSQEDAPKKLVYQKLLDDGLLIRKVS